MGLSFRDKACDMLCLDMIDMLDLDVVLLQIPIKTPSGSDPFRLRLVATPALMAVLINAFSKVLLIAYSKMATRTSPPAGVKNLFLSRTRAVIVKSRGHSC